MGRKEVRSAHITEKAHKAVTIALIQSVKLLNVSRSARSAAS